MTYTAQKTFTTGTTRCANCGDTIQRRYTDQHWSSSDHGDVCFAKDNLNRLHAPDPKFQIVRAVLQLNNHGWAVESDELGYLGDYFGEYPRDAEADAFAELL